ncbi:uncharacterized protein LOC114337663 [Diabrotica virgifera virgifera]|uniref:Uncharacterized protein LOC114337663 n=1 Tax=Diabrotica virgifera virgifera TaxID=50390 RepID=A0A6P7GJM1_DIAVI|nr:uncharacterized protein LOC114337663 [Diabrotica virgifera virgifera]
MDKIKMSKISIKSFIKKDFVKDTSSQRLTSIKLPRDLSLGGTKQHKKLYKPNLNVIRNKKVTENKLQVVNNTKLRSRRNKEPVKQKYVQSSGVFSEGIISDIVPVVRVRQDAAPKTSPTIVNTLKLTEAFKKHEDKIINDIKECTESSDSDSENISSFKYIQWNEASFKNVKSEVMPDVTIPKPDFLNFDDQKSTLGLWQLPDSFSFIKDDQRSDFNLNDAGEGIIGKILVRKSGKIDAVIGNLSYELEAVKWESFNEHLMSVSIGKFSHAVNLGSLQNRFILSPNWNQLLKD